MRRLFWMAVGAGAGIYAVRRLSRAAEAFTAAGLASGLGDSLRSFADEVRAGMAERELELRQALGLDPAAGADIHAVAALPAAASDDDADDAVNDADANNAGNAVNAVNARAAGSDATGGPAPHAARAYPGRPRKPRPRGSREEHL